MAKRKVAKKKTVKKIVKRPVKKAVKKSVKKVVARPVKKSAKTVRAAPQSPKRTVKAPVTGTAEPPCQCCGHGHFCDENCECLSCGVTRDHKHKPYKGW